ncbi:MAG TPA: alpha/beta hydrolase [Steroidobacteraceae bacterium]|nr:alpha/beta hydrolase [Steroidobacteraceae bacterium]
MSSKNAGVVIVSPNGYDMVCTYWGLRRCAEILAANGFPVLRFDLHGTGDSPGDDHQPGRVDDWLDSIANAIDFLKEQSGVTTTVLLGVRLGGTLAAVAGTPRDDIAGLILYAPCVGGRQYVREIKALAAGIRDAGDPDAESGGTNDVIMAGWLLTEQTVNDLGRLDISKLNYKGKPVLYIHRSDVNADQKLVDALQSSALDPVVRASTDYAGFAQDAIFAKEPVNDFKFMTEWLLSMRISGGASMGDALKSGSGYQTELTHPDYTEEPVQIGKDGSMFGIYCKPVRRQSELCIVFASTGAIHRIGSHRMTVDHARKLASLGISSLRLDVSGVGDSPAREGLKPNQIYSPQQVRDVTEAIDAVVQRGFGGVLVSGICSGAYIAYNAAVKDPRVKILTVVNLWRFIWRDADNVGTQSELSAASMESYVQKMAQLKTWQRLLAGKINLRYLTRAISARVVKIYKSKIRELIYAIFHPGKTANPVRRDCVALLKRGALIEMLYSRGDGGMDEVALYLGSRGKALSKYPGFSFHEIQGADHTFTTKKARSALFDTYVAAIRKYEQQSKHKAAVPGA